MAALTVTTGLLLAPPPAPTWPAADSTAAETPSPFVVLIQSADAAALGIVGIIGNGVTVARKTPAGTGWLAVGYLGAAYNLTVGALWSTTALDVLDHSSNSGWATFQAVLGGANLAIGATTLALTLKAHLQTPAPSDSDYAQLPPILPSITPVPGGGTFNLSGQF
ncbi:MAG: hypothetical protein R3F14_12875 [Polyangiaceae bacterium]